VRVSDHVDWTTLSEIKFIKGLGSFCRERCTDTSREELLRRYIAAAHIRQNWHGMDRITILCFAEEALRQEIRRIEK